MIKHCRDRVGVAAYAAIAMWLVFLGLLAAPPSAWSAGIMLYEQGTQMSDWRRPARALARRMRGRSLPIPPG